MSFLKKYRRFKFIVKNYRQIIPRIKNESLRLFSKHGIYLTENDKKISRLKNVYAGKRCFLLGNGPSLKVQDIDRLFQNNDICFAANKIYLIFDQTLWRPDFYFFIDDSFLESSQYHVSQMTDIKKILPKGITTEKNIYFPNSIYYNLRWKKFHNDNPEFSSNPLDIIYWGSTVIYSMIQFAVYMGFRSIYLLGVDADYSVFQEKPSDDLIVTDGVNSHFDVNYYQKGELHYPPNVQRHLKAYSAALQYCEKGGYKIMNASKGGKLEIFDRVDFDSLF